MGEGLKAVRMIKRKGKHRKDPIDNERKAPPLDDLHLEDNCGSRVLSGSNGNLEGIDTISSRYYISRKN